MQLQRRGDKEKSRREVEQFDENEQGAGVEDQGELEVSRYAKLIN